MPTIRPRSPSVRSARRWGDDGAEANSRKEVEIAMEPMALVGMVFSLIVLAMIGGFVLLVPISRRLGAVLELWLDERGKANQIGPAVFGRIREEVATLRDEMEALTSRQDFVENLLEGCPDEESQLPPGEGSGPSGG